MKAPITKASENKTQQSINESSQTDLGNKGLTQFMDNRQETTQLQRLQGMANQSIHVSHLAQLQAMANGPQSQKVAQKQKNNTGLPDNLKSGIENLSGMSMDDVKVHRNSDKPAQLNAHAYAQGTNIHLGSGQEKHLPHEAWHVVQQKQGRVKPTMQMKSNPSTALRAGVNVNDDAELEKEADVMGAKAMDSKGSININEPMKSISIGNGVAKQFRIIPDGDPGAGQIEAEERGTFLSFLGYNDIDPLAFTDTDFAILTRIHTNLKGDSDRVSSKSGSAKRKAKSKVSTAYDKLKNEITAKLLEEGHVEWDSQVNNAVAKYQSGDGQNTNPEYEEVATSFWAEVGGRGDMPASFWKNVRKIARTAKSDETLSAKGFTDVGTLVLNDMADQFGRWDGTNKNRGAWWGSSAPGDISGAVKVPENILGELKLRLASVWRFSDSRSGGLSFHRKRGTIDFIYHMLPVPDDDDDEDEDG